MFVCRNAWHASEPLARINKITNAPLRNIAGRRALLTDCHLPIFGALAIFQRPRARMSKVSWDASRAAGWSVGGELSDGFANDSICLG
jgi:hypothetical protein